MIILAPILSVFLLITLSPNITIVSVNPILADDGVSKNDINQSVTYEIELDLTLTHTQGVPYDDQTYKFQVARITDRNPDNPLTEYTPEYQEVDLKKNNIDGYDWINQGYVDKFGNTFDLFNGTLDYNEKITLHQEYEVKLNEIYFKDIDDDDIGTWPDASDDIYTLYNVSEECFECYDPDLIARSNSIVKSSDNAVEKAEKIYDWVKDNLDYDEYNGGDRGANWAYDNREGDCSEFSDLMITLLRIQSIPARKVAGICVSADPTYRPEIGDELNYEASYDGSKYPDPDCSESTFLGHAWVEYYVPDIGWIVCDPTWGIDDHFNYFNRIDYLHIAITVGSWFTFLPVNNSEHPVLPEPTSISDLIAVDLTDFDYEIEMTITVIDTDLIPLPGLNWFLIIMIIVIIVIAVVAIVIIAKVKSKD